MKGMTELSILVVDDNEINLMLMVDLLEVIGVTNIKTLTSGGDTIEEIKRNPTYDIIMMDICMPTMDGYEAATQIRSLGYRGRIIALTAYELTKQEGTYQAAQMDGIILKPIDLTELKHVLLQ